MKTALLFLAVSLFTSVGFSSESELCNSILKDHDSIYKLSLSVDAQASALSMDLPTPWGIRSSKYNINQLDCRDPKNIKIYSSSKNGDNIVLQMKSQKKDSVYEGIIILKSGHTSYISWKCPIKSVSDLCK